MAQDLLQISIEHHRAGRFRQAEDGYRAVLETDPGNPEAMHWLGVLLFQAGRADRAIPLLGQAAGMRPNDPAYQHNLAQASLAHGDVDDAVRSFERAAKLDPQRGESWLGLAVAYLARDGAGDAESALAALRIAQDVELDSADLHYHRGVAMLRLGRVDESVAASISAIERQADHAQAHYHLGVAQRAKGLNDDARQSLVKALELRPDYVRAMHGLAVLEAEAGNLDAAEALFRRVIAARPNAADAYRALGQVLQRAGKKQDSLTAFALAVKASRGEVKSPAGAARRPVARTPSVSVAELEKKLTPSPAAADLHFALAAHKGIFPPGHAPAPSLTQLFDRYAEDFDEHLRDGLLYGVPELIARAVAAADPRLPLDVFDLGCGTGLCGPLLRPMAARLAGVDLSAAMIEKAKARGAYDHLEVGDLVAALRSNPRAFDLLVAADVLIYTGDLAPTFEAAAAALRPGGLFAFSLEAGTGDRYALNPATHRYTHAKPYVKRLASIYGFAEEALADIVIRLESGTPVRGYLILLRLPDA